MAGPPDADHSASLPARLKNQKTSRARSAPPEGTRSDLKGPGGLNPSNPPEEPGGVNPRNPAESTRGTRPAHPEGPRPRSTRATNPRSPAGSTPREPGRLTPREPGRLTPRNRPTRRELMLGQKQRAAPLAGAPLRKPRQTWLPSVHLLRQSGLLTWSDTPPAAGRAWVPGCRARTLKRPYDISTTKFSA